MEKCVLQIKSGMYAEPFFADGSYSEEKGLLKYSWTEKHPNERIPSSFELVCDFGGKQITVIRDGDVSSKMTFKPGNRTKGSLNTMFGVIEVSGEPIKNVFSIKRLLQKSEE